MHIAAPTPPIPTEATLRRAADIKRGWRAGAEPDAVAALAADRDIAAVKSFVIDLAYEEYCLREQAGEPPDADGFCARFPRHRTSIRKVLDAHRLVTDRPDLLAPDPVGWPPAGSRFEGLDLVGELGRGAFGRAYLAFDPETDRMCVLKLSAGRSGEARVIGALSHPHVTDVYWARPVGRLMAVCMPLVGVSTLDDVRDAAFPGSPAILPAGAAVILDAIEPVDGPAAGAPPVVRPGDSYAVGLAALLCRIADALRYLHSCGTSHGDLKPSNVVLGTGGRPYLIDFNLSATGGLAMVGGTLPYMAPEHLRRAVAGGGDAIDAAKADVYAFAALAVELLTGRVPVDPPAAPDPMTAAADLLAHLSAVDREAAVFLPGTPPPVVRLVLRCLALDPAQRPTASEVVRSWRRTSVPHGASARPGGGSAPPSWPVGRLRWAGRAGWPAPVRRPTRIPGRSRRSKSRKRRTSSSPAECGSSVRTSSHLP